MFLSYVIANVNVTRIACEKHINIACQDCVMGITLLTILGSCRRTPVGLSKSPYGKVHMSDSQKHRQSVLGSVDELPKGILDARSLPDDAFDSLWDSVFVDQQLKDR